MPPPRDDVLRLLNGGRLARLPVFAGLPCLTAPGLAAAGVRYAEAHDDPARMAAAAASTFEMFGFESVVVPFDLCVEAEALGAEMDAHAGLDGFLPPVISRPIDLEAVPAEWPDPDGLEQRGRVPLVCDALARLKAGEGRHAAVGAWVPGPFTLGWQACGAAAWLGELAEPERLKARLARLAAGLARVAAAYRAAGADFITIHDMGGSPQAVGPRVFQGFVLPALQQLVRALPGPVVVSVCGDTNAVIDDLGALPVAGLNVDHRNDLARTRQRLPGARLLGNFDPVGVLAQGTPDDVRAAVRAIAAAGADAVWPGCDLWPEVAEENVRALVEEAKLVQRA